MSKKIDKMIENDFNKSYRTNVLIDYSIFEFYNEDIKESFKPKFIWQKCLTKVFLIIIVTILVFVGCLSVKQYTAGKMNLAQSIHSSKVIDEKYIGLGDVDLVKLHRIYDNFCEIPILVIYHFDDIRIYVFWSKDEISNEQYIHYFCFVEYAENNNDITTISVDGKEELNTNQTIFKMIASRQLELPNSNNQLEFVVNYRGESRKTVAIKK